jgi:Icc-related predicted phosphoesterase
MRIWHVSDNHGYFPELQGEFDVVIHSGDLFPNHSFGPKRHWSIMEMEKAFQTDWINNRAETIKEWVKEKPFLFCSGNHDFVDPCPTLNEAGLTAINLNDKVTEFEGLTLYGFPWVPFIEGGWNFELMDVEMRVEIDRMFEKLLHRNSRPDILVTHSPPYGKLDLCRPAGRLGNQFLANAISYSFEQLPKLLLCGHIHSGYGIDQIDDCTVSNGAIGDLLVQNKPVPPRILTI